MTIAIFLTSLILGFLGWGRFAEAIQFFRVARRKEVAVTVSLWFVVLLCAMGAVVHWFPDYITWFIAGQITTLLHAFLFPVTD